MGQNDINTRKKRKDSHIAIGGIAVVIVMVGIGLWWISIQGKQTIKLSDYIAEEYSGIEGGGRVQFVVDKEKLYTDIAGDEKNTVVLDKYMQVVESVVATTSNHKNLSNGDTINISVTYDYDVAHKVKCKFNGLEYTAKVSGLGAGRLVDIFEYVDVTVAGISPEVYANVVNKWMDEYLKNISFSVDKSNGITAGDTIVVSCNASREELEEHGIAVTNMSKEYKVDKVNSYVSDISQLDMALIKTISDEAISTISIETESLTFRMFYKATNDSSYLFQYNTEWVNSTELVSAVFLSKNNNAEVVTRNYVYLLYKANISNGTITQDIYFAFEYTDGIVSQDGIFTMTHTDAKSRYICGVDYNDVYGRVVLSKGNSYSITMFSL